MPAFRNAAEVEGTVDAVEAFHSDPGNFRKLTPLPVQIHRYESSGPEGVIDFTVWFGPLPVRWEARLERFPGGFVDRQGRGPMESWEHTHRFTSVSPAVTLIEDSIEYTYQEGWRGWVSRLAFSPPALRVLFAYRVWRTRRALKP